MIDATHISAIERRRRGLGGGRVAGPRGQRAGRHRHRDQDRPDHALQRAGLGLWRDRQDRGRLFQDDQRAGRRERPQDQSASASTTATARPRPSSRSRRLVEQEQVAFMFNSLGTARQRRDPAISQRQQGAAAVRRDRRQRCSAIPSTFPGRSASSRTTRPRRAIYGKHILATKPDAQDRRALPERRLRQGLSDRPEGRARRRTMPA